MKKRRTKGPPFITFVTRASTISGGGGVARPCGGVPRVQGYRHKPEPAARLPPFVRCGNSARQCHARLPTPLGFAASIPADRLQSGRRPFHCRPGAPRRWRRLTVCFSCSLPIRCSVFRANHRPPTNTRSIAPICCVAKFSYLHLGYAGKEGRSLRHTCRGSAVEVKQLERARVRFK